MCEILLHSQTSDTKTEIGWVMFTLLSRMCGNTNMATQMFQCYDVISKPDLNQGAAVPLPGIWFEVNYSASMWQHFGQADAKECNVI